MTGAIGLFDKTGAYMGGYSYSPYGEARATGTNTATAYNHLRYISGYYDDATNLYKLGARNYDPAIGRFAQYDPSGQEAHPYAYAGCNPINAKDPTGLASACSYYTNLFGAAGLVALGAQVAAAMGAITIIGGVTFEAIAFGAGFVSLVFGLEALFACGLGL